MGIYPAAGNLAYKTSGATLDTILEPGQRRPKCGRTGMGQLRWHLQTAVNLTVGSSSGIRERDCPPMQKPLLTCSPLGGWHGYALLPPNYPLCTWCSPSGPETTWSWTTGLIAVFEW